MISSRPTWDEVWTHIAEAISARSLCVRAQVGAVIIDVNNRIVATGYNNPPRGFQHDDRPCSEWCYRGGHDEAMERGEIRLLHRDYSDCPSLHAEANALVAADRSTWQAGTIYVTSDVCYACAKLIANSGLGALVVRPDGEDRSYRDTGKTYEFLESCGIEVITHG